MRNGSLVDILTVSEFAIEGNQFYSTTTRKGVQHLNVDVCKSIVYTAHFSDHAVHSAFLN